VKQKKYQGDEKGQLNDKAPKWPHVGLLASPMNQCTSYYLLNITALSRKIVISTAHLDLTAPMRNGRAKVGGMFA